MINEKSIPEKIQGVLNTWYGDCDRNAPKTLEEFMKWFKASCKIYL